MRIDQQHWQGVETYLKSSDLCVLPLGCTEQHAFLSLATDSILAEKISLDAASPLGIPVFPVLAYGMTPLFASYPGTVTLSAHAYFAVLADVIGSLRHQGFQRILIVNGHGGNTPARALTRQISADGSVDVRWHDWWNAPKTWAKVQAIDPVASHASWMENFPWTRLPGVAMPDRSKPVADTRKMVSAAQTRELLGDGNFGGLYQRGDAEMFDLWAVAVAETSDLLSDW